VGPDDFVAELAGLGYELTRYDGGRISFSYVIPTGARAGETISLGLTVPGDSPLSCPGGPVIRPRLLPLNPDASAGHPMGAVHESPEFGEEWEYLSRPYPGWHDSNRTASAYLAHIAHLFEGIP
jgi:hypothetical protein